MGKLRIVYRGHGGAVESLKIQPDIGERYIIHKPDDLRESPTWVSPMDMFDGRTIQIIDTFVDPRGHLTYKYGWEADLTDIHYEGHTFYFHINWLEKIDNFSDLDESTVNFFDI